MKVFRVLAIAALLSPLTAPADPEPSPAAPDAQAGLQAPLVLSGTLVKKAPDALIVRDGEGNEHRFLLTRLTRFVWSETSSPEDLVPGASVRAVYVTRDQRQIATSIWVVSGPPGRSG